MKKDFVICYEEKGQEYKTIWGGKDWGDALTSFLKSFEVEDLGNVAKVRVFELIEVFRDVTS